MITVYPDPIQIFEFKYIFVNTISIKTNLSISVSYIPKS